MKKIELKFKKLEVSRTFPRDNSVEIKLTVNDGRDKCFAKSVKLDNVAEVADVLIRDVRARVKESHKSIVCSDDFLGGVVVLKLLDDEDLLLDRIAKFLAGAREKFRAASFGKCSYYDVEMQLKRSSVEF